MRIVYIAGAGRSGSTLLERLLGSAPDAVALGEVHSLWRLPLAALRCSCGAPGPECAFWDNVRRIAGLTDARLRDLAVLEHDSIRHLRIARAGFSLPRFHRDEKVMRFTAMQRDLFDAVATQTGARFVIDSSKAGPRAWALAGLPGTRIIHLMRDRRAVVASWGAEKHDPSLGGPMRQIAGKAVQADRARAFLSARLLARYAPVHKLAYEALTDDPHAAMAALAMPDLTDSIAWRGAARFAPDGDYHTLNGNPDRFSRGEITIRPARPSLLLQEASP